MVGDVCNQDRRGASSSRVISICPPPRNAAPKRTADQEVPDDLRALLGDGRAMSCPSASTLPEGELQTWLPAVKLAPWPAIAVRRR
jgi:hypothetical protein